MPPPKLVTVLPVGSSLMTGSSVELLQAIPPQRSKIQTLLPSGSMAMPSGAPILRPPATLAQFVSAAAYGLGAELGSLPCAPAGGVDVTIAAKNAIKDTHF